MEKGVYRLMPLYNFKCDECGNYEEVFQKMLSEHKLICTCGKYMRRLFNATPFSFEFWYGWDAGIGEYISTKKDRDNILAERGMQKING